jgi:transmembrane sensor
MIFRSSEREIRETAATWLARMDGERAESERVEFELWRAADPRHAEAVEELCHAWTALDRPRNDGHVEWMRLRLTKRMKRRVRLRVAAVAVCVVAGFATIQQVTTDRWSTAAAVASSARVMENTRVVLPDGSTAELAPEARIETDFSGEVRRVTLLVGDAHFDVLKDPARPFLVIADGVQVRAVGTAFAVGVSSTGVQVVVTHGTVAVGDAGESDRMLPGESKSTMLLEAGHALVVAAHTNVSTMPITLDQPELARRLAWRVPRLEFTDTPLREAIALFNQRSDVHLRIVDVSLRELRITGVFRADNSEGFVELLERAFPLTAERVDGEIVLRPKNRR